MLSNIGSVYPNVPKAENIKNVEDDVSHYLNDEECGYIKVLHRIGQLKTSDDFVKDVCNIIDTSAVPLFQDKLLTFLLSKEPFKNLLDVVWENSTATKITVVEIGARYGGLFFHIVPLFMSEPLLQLEFLATDSHVSTMPTALTDRLEKLRVNLSQFDINDNNVSGFSNKDFVVVRGLAQQSECIMSALQKIHSMMAEGGFLLLYEVTSNFELYFGVDEIIHQHPRKDLIQRKHGIYLTSAEWKKRIESSGFEIIQQLCDSFSSTVFLCRRLKHVGKDVFISVTGNEFDWVEDVKIEMNEEQSENDIDRKIWLVADRDFHSGIVGMVNCLRKEDGGNKIRCIFNAGGNSDLQGAVLELSSMAKLARKDLVMNVFKDGSWGSFRHSFLPQKGRAALGTHAYVNSCNLGDFGSLCWIESSDITELKSPGHVFCAVNYSSLNFRDVMIASGKLTADAIPEHLAHEECLIGFEFSGRNQEGKRVMGIVPNKGLATFVNAESHLLFDVPDEWSLEDAATVPVIYCTVYYALIVRGQLKCGESILIHSGSGGVGQAAISIAASYGCTIYTTVGTNDKRRFLMKKFSALTESSFANSHDLSFEEHVIRQTKGSGVNLILNSLAGKKLDASLRCLSKNGRFLEIGKYDLSQNRLLGASIFLKNTSFHGIHVDHILQKGNTEWLQVYDLMQKGLRNGVVQPIARTVFSPDEVENAFRFMAQGKHIGKVLIKVKPEETATTPLWKSIPVKSRSSPHPKKVYVIVGGLGGFGLELADWLILRGCMKLVLSSRSGITTGYQRRCISRWEARGVAVIVSKTDVSEPNQCSQLLLKCQKMGPIGGIFNLALVLKDGFLENLNSNDFRAVCKPKIEVARSLDEATRKLCGPELDWFVMFSSVSSGRGNAGQSNYGFGNSAMERLCEERNKENLPGLSIQWGVIGDVGRVVDTMEGDETEIAGCVSQTIESCLSTLDLFLLQPYPVLSTFVPADREKSISENTPKIDIENFVAKFFGIKDVSSANQNITLAELGLDSLMGVEVKQTLERDFGTILSMKRIRSLTLQSLLNDFGRGSSSNIGKTQNNSNCSLEKTISFHVSPILSSKETGCLVQLNTGQKQHPPVFLFHPLEGTIDIFRPLIPSLKDHPVYALTVNKQVSQESIFKMATYYLSAMRSIQPDGPYNIAGYSFGAILALELVIYLQNEHNITQKHNLMLIDASPDYVSSRFRIVIEDQLEQEDIQAVGLRDATNIQILTQFIQGFKQIASNELKQKLLAKATYSERLDLAVSLLLEVFPSVDEEDMYFSVDSYVKRTWLLKDYMPKSNYRGNVTLLKATSSTEVPDQERTNDYGLSKVCILVMS
ncbi:Fatty acid synthase [Holothuria leucospilota]|uniref:oleoyl-[acyl-carrier-protein] hydrolase n=1 Tax=Holothuria leucospilota TaxID=206669 RepID=A0A9Q1BI68_HOLLE|nr:Fatty acid synthase [Holothuria leucospilota]